MRKGIHVAERMREVDRWLSGQCAECGMRNPHFNYQFGRYFVILPS